MMATLDMLRGDKLSYSFLVESYCISTMLLRDSGVTITGLATFYAIKYFDYSISLFKSLIFLFDFSMDWLF